MISLDIRRWTVPQLFGASALYWVGLAVATLTPFARTVQSIGRLGGNRGTATGSITDDVITLSALKDGVVVYTANASLLSVALWISLPPLALWLLWLALRPARTRAGELHESTSYAALPDAAPNGLADRTASSRTEVRVEPRERRS